MPKLRNVSATTLESLASDADSIIGGLHDLSERIGKGYVEPIAIADLVDRIAFFNALTRASASLVSNLLVLQRLAMQRAELDALRARDKGADNV